MYNFFALSTAMNIPKYLSRTGKSFRLRSKSIFLPRNKYEFFSISLRLRHIFKTSFFLFFILYLFIQTKTQDSNFPLSSLQAGLVQASPLVTIVLTECNAESDLRRSLRAVLSQTYSNLEIFVIDSFSSRNKSESISYTGAHDMRVTYLQLTAQTLGSIGTKSNIGIERSNGKYIVFLDENDILHPHFVKKMVSVAEKSKAEVTICNFRSFRSKTNITLEAYDLRYWPSPGAVTASRTHPLDPHLDPGIFSIAKARFRNLYKTDFLSKYNILFSESDFLFEEKSFFWIVNIYARKFSFLDEPLVTHQVEYNLQHKSTALKTASFYQKRKERDIGLQMFHRNEEEELLRILGRTRMMHNFPNVNFIGNHVSKCSKSKVFCSFLHTEFLKWIIGMKRNVKSLRRGRIKKVFSKASSVYSMTVKYWLDRLEGYKIEEIRERIPNHIMRLYDRPRENIMKKAPELSIVVPTYNVQTFLASLVELFEHLTVSFEVIFIDNNSTDGTLGTLKELTDSFHNMHVLQVSEKGAGRARNFGLLFCEGTYVFFLDPDDLFRPRVLDSATRYAIKENIEVLLFIYEIEHVRQRKTCSGYEVLSSHSMWDSDKKLFSELKTGNLDEKKAKAAGITNYPWNKLVKRDLLIRENISFGPTIVNDDVQYHWHAILTSCSIGIYENESLYRHRRFEDRITLTEASGPRRLQTLDALAFTNRVLLKNGMSRKRVFQNAWREFSKKLLLWGLESIGAENKAEYTRRSKDLLQIIESENDWNLLFIGQ